jgi:hypothetical protein
MKRSMPRSCESRIYKGFFQSLMREHAGRLSLLAVRSVPAKNPSYLTASHRQPLRSLSRSPSGNWPRTLKPRGEFVKRFWRPDAMY